MPWDYLFDPLTDDLIPDGKGSFERTETAATSMQNQLKAHYGKALQDAELGSLLFDRDRFKTDPAHLMSAEARRALQRLERAGRITAIEIVAEQPKAGRVNITTRARDTSGAPLVASFTKPGG